jgi:hypothetical protein
LNGLKRRDLEIHTLENDRLIDGYNCSWGCGGLAGIVMALSWCFSSSVDFCHGLIKGLWWLGWDWDGSVKGF